MFPEAAASNMRAAYRAAVLLWNVLASDQESNRSLKRTSLTCLPFSAPRSNRKRDGF